MTAETLKPFITPNSSEHFPATHARPCRGQCSSKWIALGLSATCLVMTAVLVGVTVWQITRITNLETNLKSLNGVVESMQKRLGLEYLDDLHEFEKEYTNALIDDPTDIDDDDDEDDINLDDNDEDLDDEDDDDEDIDNLDDDDDFDDDDDDDDSDIYDEMLDNYENMDAMVKKYHEDITNENIDDDVSDGSMSTDSNVLKDFEKFNDFKKKQSTRKTRSISNASNGLPLFESSYLKQVNKTDTNGGALDVPKDNQLTEESHVVEPHHQQHQQHSMKKPTMRIQSTDALSHHRTAHGRHIVSESLHERRRSPLRPRTQRRRKLPLTKSGESQFSAKYTNAQTSLLSMEPLRPAAHFHLNRKVPDRHAAIRVDSYPGDMYIGAPSWSHEFDIEHYFHVDQGVLTVREPGLYYIYAQVCYNNSHDQNGFVIFHGHKPYLQCLNTVPTNMPLKIHTCHTSGLVYLRANDTMHLRDFHSDRNVILKDTNNRSYFGLMKV